jgi:hypothetical protein
MKFIAVRLIENKDPVMLFAGKINNCNPTGLFWKIDEVADPHRCEYKQVDVKDFSLVWPLPMESEETKFEGYAVSSDCNLAEYFEDDSGWIEIGSNRLTERS